MGWGSVQRHGEKPYLCDAWRWSHRIGAAISTGVAGCNPDFNYAVVGTVTRWTPVKNLTFSADLAYTMLDQKFAAGSTFTAPAAVSVAKPGAVYELKDQSSLVLLLRAQRNW